MNANSTMSPADLLVVIDDCASKLDFHYRDTRFGKEMRTAFAAVAALIEREAALVADLARVSEELGLPPKIGPAPGVIAAMKAERGALEERVKALEEALQAIERRTFRHPEDAADDHRRNLFHAHSIAKAALARAEADNG